MPAPPNGLQPSTVSQEELSKLEDELLATFTKARPGSGAYSGSNHVANPSTSSLPDPSSSNARSVLPRPSSTTPNGRNARPRPLPPTPGTSGTPYTPSGFTVRSVSRDSENGRLPSAPQSGIDGSSSTGLPTPAYAQNSSSTIEGHSTTYQSQAWNPPYDPTTDELNRYSYPRDSLSITLPEYTRRDPSTFLAVPPYLYSQLGISTNFNDSSELPTPQTAHSLSAIDLDNSLLHPPRTQSDQTISSNAPDAFTSVPYDQSSVSESQLSYTDSPPTARVPVTRTSTEISMPPYGNPASDTSSLAITRTNSDGHRDFDSGSSTAVPSNATLLRRPSAVLHVLMSDSRGTQQSARSRSEQEEEVHWRGEYGDEEETRFVNFALLSHLAVLLRDKVPRGTHVKGSIAYPRAFTGKDVVTTIHTQIKRELVWNHGGRANGNDRRVALHVARSLQSQLFFYEVEWGARKLQDGVEDVYMLMDDREGDSDGPPDREELPTSVVTVLTRCYSPMCDAGEVESCYAYSCPRKADSLSRMLPKADAPDEVREWVPPPEVFQSLPENERKRQSIIRKLIEKEEQYVRDLDIVETFFINPLRMANPPIISADDIDQFIDDVFLNIFELRECNRRLLESLYVRQREQAPVIQRIGDILLEAATDFRESYAQYVGRHPIADKRLKDELERNPEFRLFIEKCSRRQSARPGENLRLDLRHFLSRPSEHMQKYPVLLQAIVKETEEGNPDVTYLREAIEALNNLQDAAQLQTFQAAMGKGITGRWEWRNLVSQGLMRNISDEECRRQSRIFELIKSEIAYVRDLESIEVMYIRPLQNADPPIIPQDRLGDFMQNVFYNWAELHSHHRRLLDTLYEIQREEHPRIRSVTAPVFDGALNFREAYMEYIPNYPIAEYRIEDEMRRNPIFKEFAETCVQHPDAHMLDMKGFINRPILQLLQYDELLRAILDEAPRAHEDRESIPQVLEVIKALGRETEPGVLSAKQKVKLWGYNAGLVYKRGETIDLDLLHENRSLIHTGKLLRQPESGSEPSGWKELFVLLFDNYLVMTNQEQQQDNMTKYRVYRRPIPLDLLSLVSFTDPATPRSAVFRHRRDERRAGSSASSTSASEDGESRSLYPFTIHYNARLGGTYVLHAESAHGRAEWKQKLEEAMGLRKVVQESNKVFEMETLSVNTFNVQPVIPAPSLLATWSEGGLITGKVTCSIPFNTPDGRPLVAIGCAEGVWIGFRHDSRSMRRVLHLPLVTQCTILNDFGLFLVLADKALLAYHIEALVPPTTQPTIVSQAPQRLNGNKEVQFFSVGNVLGRTLVIYMRKKGTGSHFHALEPIVDRIHEKAKEPTGRFGRFRSHKPEWFKPYKEFTLPHESYDLVFLKAKIAVLCTKGFEIMDINKFESVSIPSEDPRLAPLGKRLETCRPIGIFRFKEDEFLLCYAEFGIYVDKQGDPSRNAGTIEWEGCADSAALHAPYVLLFDSRFIEIRHVETGRLAQILPGNDIRCVWNGRGLDSNNALTPSDVSDDQMLQEAQIHAVSNLIEPSVQPVGRPPKAVTQYVFELTPTIPLYLPGSLSSPSTLTYFPQLFSPSHSPPLH